MAKSAKFLLNTLAIIKWIFFSSKSTEIIKSGKNCMLKMTFSRNKMFIEDGKAMRLSRHDVMDYI